jgi:gamma-glutamyltranspeptidase/glutathione hydrolase
VIGSTSGAATLVRRPALLVAVAFAFAFGQSGFATPHASVPVELVPVRAPHGMVVAAHPEVAAIGAAILEAGGNAMDAAVGVSLALGVAEPFGSGLGGKLMLLHHDATTGETVAVDGMDQAGWSLDAEAYRALPTAARYDGWSAVALPGLPFALHAAHARWGARPWADNVRPAADLARRGFTVLPKTRDLFEERIEKLRADPHLATLYLPGGELPEAHARLPHPALADTLERFAREGIEAFRSGSIAAAVVAASEAGGGHLTLDDFARYEPRFVEPVSVDHRDHRLLGGPPPTSGAALAFAMLEAIEEEPLAPPLRSVANLDRIGRVWREIVPIVRAEVGDAPGSRERVDALLSPVSIDSIRTRAFGEPAELVAADGAREDASHDATTHFIVVDRAGNVVCATQSLSLHFGAGVMAAGMVMNDSMSNFTFGAPDSPNFVAAGRRPRSTITPTIVLRDGRPVLALGVPGAQRIPTAVFQVLLDRLAFGRDLGAAIGDTRVHWFDPISPGAREAIEAEQSLPAETAAALRELGWKVDLREPAGTGRHFGGVNAIELHPDGSRTGWADPRRTNAAAGH